MSEIEGNQKVFDRELFEERLGGRLLEFLNVISFLLIEVVAFFLSELGVFLVEEVFNL